MFIDGLVRVLLRVGFNIVLLSCYSIVLFAVVFVASLVPVPAPNKSPFFFSIHKRSP